MSFKGQIDYDHKGDSPGSGVLLTNLGTPDQPTATSVRRYLREFLSDPRVVEIPRLLWWLILHLFILPFRSKSSAKLYQQVWTDAGSPLLDITLRQAHALQQKLDQNYGENSVIVQAAMRYGNPSIAHGLANLTAKNVRKIIVLPLYPQYCASTVGSTFDAVANELKQYRWVPEIKFISGYHMNSQYISAISKSIDRYIGEQGMPDKIVVSYHGIPERYLHQGDPYYCFCMQTTRLMIETLKLDPEKVQTSFQSRFGKASWLKPYTDETLKMLAADGNRHVAIICPGFSSDCLETIEEIEVENRAYFMQAGGEKYDYIDCLNDSEEHIEMMYKLIQKQLPDELKMSSI